MLTAQEAKDAAHAFLRHFREGPEEEEESTTLFQGAVAYMRITMGARRWGLDGRHFYITYPVWYEGGGRHAAAMARLIELLCEYLHENQGIVRVARLLSVLKADVFGAAIPSPDVVMEAAVFQGLRERLPWLMEDADGFILRQALKMIIRMQAMVEAQEAVEDTFLPGAHRCFMGPMIQQQGLLHVCIMSLTAVAMHQFVMVNPDGARLILPSQLQGAHRKEWESRGEWLEALVREAQLLGPWDAVWITLLACMRRVAKVTPFMPESMAHTGAIARTVVESIAYHYSDMEGTVSFPKGVTSDMYHWANDARVWHVVNWAAIWVLIGSPMVDEEIFPGPMFVGDAGIENGVASSERLHWEACLLAMAVMEPQRRFNYWWRWANEDDAQHGDVRADVVRIAELASWIQPWWGRDDVAAQHRHREDVVHMYHDTGRAPMTSEVLYQGLLGMGPAAV